MVIRLDGVRDEPFRWQEVLEVDVSELARPELEKLGPVAWDGVVSYLAPDFHLHANYRYEQHMTCSRCLCPVVEPVIGALDLLVTIGPPVAESGEHQIHVADLGVLTVSDERWDVLPLLKEQLQLEVPMRPLCRPDCKGLCPVCGAELNAGPCGCNREGGDPRWAALAALRGRVADKPPSDRERE